MLLAFHKYQGTGNDFIMIDDRKKIFPANDMDLVRRLCDRRFGIGADGLILIRNYPELDFEMIYFNSDGTQSLCGNGSRCAIKFVRALKKSKPEEANFQTIEGKLSGFIRNDLVHLRMPDVTEMKPMGEDLFIHTGSPHYIRFVLGIDQYDVFNEGSRIRYSGLYGDRGVNVNFIEDRGNNGIFVRTYERGVENETLSCGTGVTACAIAGSLKGKESPVEINTRGGKLMVSFRKESGRFTDIYLIGPAEKVYEGKVEM